MLDRYWPRAALAVAGAVVGISSAAPADAQTAERQRVSDLAEEAFEDLQLEIILLVELDGLPRPLPFELEEIWSNGRSMVADLDRSGLLDALRDADLDGEAVLNELRGAGALLSQQTEVALMTLLDDDLTNLERNDIVSVFPQDYVGAWYDLRERDGAPPSGGPGQPSGEPATQPIDPRTGQPQPTIVDPSRFDGRDLGFADPVDTPAGPPVLAIAGGAVLLVLLGGAGAVLARRGSAGSPVVEVADSDAATRAGDLMARLLEAGRRMTKALEQAEIARIAVAESVSLVGGTHGAFIRVAPDAGIALVHESIDGLVDQRRLDQGALGRVAETGQPANLVSGDEPSLTSLPAALVLTPVIGNGRVEGVVLVVRPDDRPFTSREHQALQQLAPMVASALDAAAQHDSVAEMTMTDGLTSLANRRRLDRDLETEAGGPDRPIGFVMVDVDHFKTYNDTHGHGAGDECLQMVASILSDNVRDVDVVYRYGGEEFSVLLPDCGPDDGRLVVERLRSAIESTDFPGGGTQPGGRVTASFGLAFARSADADSLKVAADQALYRAKHAGRNRVEVASVGDEPTPV